MEEKVASRVSDAVAPQDEDTIPTVPTFETIITDDGIVATVFIPWSHVVRLSRGEPEGN